MPDRASPDLRGQIEILRDQVLALGFAVGQPDEIGEWHFRQPPDYDGTLTNLLDKIEILESLVANLANDVGEEIDELRERVKKLEQAES